MAFFELCYFTR